MDILVTIFNYNCNENALRLLSLFSKSFKTVVLDSGSDIKNDKFLLYDNIYYNGLINESYNLTEKYNKEWLLFITSDIIISDNEYSKLETFLLESDIKDMGSYSPSASHDSYSGHTICKNNFTCELRSVNYVEGYFTLVRSNIIKEICPINLDVNKYGWLTDILIGYYCEINDLKCYIDDNIIIKHPDGRGYDTDDAMNCMFNHIKFLNNTELNNYIRRNVSWCAWV